jgi:hypothetical protein
MEIMRQRLHKSYPAVRYGARSEILPAMTPKRITRFLSRIDRSAGALSCHPFTGSTNQQGYGLVQGCDNYLGFSFLAHRVAWAIEHQIEPGSAVIRHSCDNPPCCNGAHLLNGLHIDNTADMIERGRANFQGSKGFKGPDANAADYSHEQRALAINLRYTEHWRIAAIAQVIGCHRGTLMRWFAEYERI